MTIKAGFISSAPGWHWIRQFPNSEPVWNGVEFSFEGDFADCDIVFVYDAIPDSLTKRLVAKRCMFVASEPPSVKVYDSDFLSQFDCILTPDLQTPHRDKRTGPLGLPWLVGAYDADGRQSSRPMTYNDFRDYRPSKSKLISVVSSNKAFTPGHRLRLEFVEKLKSHFGDNIDVFGRNINGFSDKTEVLSAYHYHIAIENSAYPHYWTEKISDPLLTLTYPIYYGSQNIGDYLDNRSFTAIDINDPDSAISSIKKIIEANTAEVCRPHLEKARDHILNQFNIFNILSNYAQESGRVPAKERVLVAEKKYEKKKKRRRNLVRIVRKIFR
ncbi:hypothetical protein RRU01S_03_03140 [Agrobacterium rubi TR3 = NBRC 13261]|uniref:Fucosyltransferase C-terminal domain-containing protein n=1 Tax=Agrobacterium rubi TR3 = NBRC 13261 TaxID=1368415 RepID=A0A081CR46_9HYPH|nr:glycosyltransferase family 10 [Agrobacterium rubi]MBP1877052.1 hypothetical protein [Agrobacterium rubi]MCL6651236.1 hypothetical protein [Agrobacterium rubi]GAK69142.1 hypothetical protein RRU01S_03_03140 [Agrobacterium rubi TR3 = NBRC 13261]